MHLYNVNGISYIASVLSRHLHMDRGTSDQLHLEFVRVCIEIEIACGLQESIQLGVGEGLIVEIKVTFPWMPKKCRKYGLFGHDYSKKKGEQYSLLNDNPVAAPRNPSSQLEEEKSMPLSK